MPLVVQFSCVHQYDEMIDNEKTKKLKNGVGQPVPARGGHLVGNAASRNATEEKYRDAVFVCCCDLRSSCYHYAFY